MGIIVWAILAITFNILDSVTTEISLRRFPEGLRGTEGNPIMAKLMSKNPILTEVLKQGLVIGIIGYYIYVGEVFYLILIAIALGLVVLNNTYLIIIKLITKRKHLSPFFLLAQFCQLPKVLYYPFIFIVIFDISFLATYLVYGGAYV